MTYDFTSILDRKGKDALAVDAPPLLAPVQDGFDLIPMWVADMNFPVCPAVTDAIRRRLDHPTFGYFDPRAEYYDAIIRWQKDRHGVEGLEPRHIGYENGVLGGVASALAAICGPGDKVLLHSPTYVGFTHTLEDNGYHMVHSPLVRDGQGVWRMDFEDMEEKIVQNNIHAAILCSPHNPSGRVWERWELEQAMALFEKHDVYVVSDEIWADVVRPGARHIPTQSVSGDAKGRTVALYAPTKTFNLAGFVGSYHIIYDKRLRDQVCRQAERTHYNEMNLLSMYALLGAYTDEGAAWADQLNTVLAANADYACDFIADHFEGVRVTKPQGTYMLFLDCTQWCADHGKSLDDLLAAGHRVGVAWQDGRPFGGPCHIRVNLALPLSRVQEAFDRLERYVFQG